MSLRLLADAPGTTGDHVAWILGIFGVVGTFLVGYLAIRGQNKTAEAAAAAAKAQAEAEVATTHASEAKQEAGRATEAQQAATESMDRIAEVGGHFSHLVEVSQKQAEHIISMAESTNVLLERASAALERSEAERADCEQRQAEALALIEANQTRIDTLQRDQNALKRALAMHIPDLVLGPSGPG